MLILNVEMGRFPVKQDRRGFERMKLARRENLRHARSKKCLRTFRQVSEVPF